MSRQSTPELKQRLQNAVEAFSFEIQLIGLAASDTEGFDLVGWEVSRKAYRDDLLNPKASDFVTRLDEAATVERDQGVSLPESDRAQHGTFRTSTNMRAA